MGDRSIDNITRGTASYTIDIIPYGTVRYNIYGYTIYDRSDDR